MSPLIRLSCFKLSVLTYVVTTYIYLTTYSHLPICTSMSFDGIRGSLTEFLTMKGPRKHEASQPATDTNLRQPAEKLKNTFHFWVGESRSLHVISSRREVIT